MPLQTLLPSGCVVQVILCGLSMREVAAFIQCGRTTSVAATAMDFGMLRARIQAWMRRHVNHIRMLPLIRLPSLAEMEARQLRRDAWFRCQVMPAGERAQMVIPSTNTWGHLERWFGLWRLCGADSPFSDGRVRFVDTVASQLAGGDPSRACLLSWSLGQRDCPLAQFYLANKGVVRTFVFDQCPQQTRVGSFIRAQTFIFAEASWHAANIRLIVSVGLEDDGDTLISELL